MATRALPELSQRKTIGDGRPPVIAEIRRLILDMATANPLWRAPRIHGELKMLGILVSERSVSRILRSIPRPPSQSWKIFINNHGSEIMAVDFFLCRRSLSRSSSSSLFSLTGGEKFLYLNVTEHPTAAWISQQLVAAVADRDGPRYLICDRDRVYGRAVTEKLASLNVQQVMTTPASRWQNSIVERLMGSIRSECLDHVIVFNRWHLKRITR